MHRILPALLSIVYLLFSIPSPAYADTIGAGDMAPGFELRDQRDQIHSLEDYLDQWVLLFFYPKDGTPGCTTEACEFRDNVFAFRKLNCQILGISLDDQQSHKEFADKHGLPFPLLADSQGTTADAYGVKSTFLFQPIAKRQTFLINPEGVVAIHYENVDPDTHTVHVLDDLRALQE